MIARLARTLRFIRGRMTRDHAVELLWVVAGQAVTLLMGFVILKLMTRMGREAFGEYTLTLTISSLLGLILYGPVEQGFIRFYYHYSNLSREAPFVALMYRFLLWSGLMLCAATVLFSGIALLLNELRLAMLGLIAGAYIAALKADEFFNTALNVIRKRRENYILQIAHKIAMAAVLFALYTWSFLTLLPALTGLMAVTLLAVLVKYVNYGRHLARAPLPSGDPVTERAEMIGRMKGYVLPFMIWGVTAWLQLNGEKWILADFLSVGDVGVYAVMMSVVNVFLVIPNGMMMEYISPIVFRHFADLGNATEMEVGHRYIRLTVLLVVVLTALSSLVAAVAARPLIVLVSSDDYIGFAHLMPLLALGAGLFLVGQAMSGLGMALNLPGRYLPPKILIGIMSVIANVLFIRRFGVAGVAYSAVVIGGAYMLAVALINRLILHELRARRDASGVPHAAKDAP
jgi:O-antigen/teichoic acid export membrane protein